MEWNVALCLSVPVGLGIAAAGLFFGLGAEAIANAIDRVGAAADRAVWRLAKRLADPEDDTAPTIAAAHVKAAKYRAGFVRPKAAPVEPSDLGPFDQWMRDAGGRDQPENVQHRVEWAMSRIAGQGSDQGGLDRAERILAADAPGYLPVVRKWLDRLAREG